MNEFPELSKTQLSSERLLAFCKVAAHGGIKAIARSDSEQSKISIWIRELSECFGVELTRRQGKGIALTPAGEELARLCREHFLALEDFDQRCREEPPVIAVGSGDSFLQWLVLPRLEKIRVALKNPRIEISNLRTEDIVKGIMNLTLDFGLIRNIAVPKQCESAVIGTYSYSIWMPKTLAPPTDPKQLNKFLEKLSLAVVKTQWGGVFDDLALK